MNALAPSQRYELLCIADARLSVDLGIDALVDAAERLESFVLGGVSLPNPVVDREPVNPVVDVDQDPIPGPWDGAPVDLSCATDAAVYLHGVDLIPDLPTQAVEEAQPVKAEVPPPAVCEPDPDAERLLDGVYAQLVEAVEKGLPCPRNVDLGGLIGITGGATVGGLVGRLRDSGRIEVETRGCKRRVGIGGRWTLWTGEAPVVVAPPAADPLGTAVTYLRSRGFEVAKIAGDWMINDRDITPEGLIQKAEQVRTRSENAKTV